LKVCNDLSELKWIKGDTAKLPRSSKAHLRAAKIRDGSAYKIANQFIADQNANKASFQPALLTACLLYVLHEAMESEIEKVRCMRQAQREAIHRLHDAVNAKREKMQLWAEAQAKEHVIAEARSSCFCSPASWHGNARSSRT